jgi:hypothetical protein
MLEVVERRQHLETLSVSDTASQLSAAKKE